MVRIQQHSINNSQSNVKQRSNSSPNNRLNNRLNNDEANMKQTLHYCLISLGWLSIVLGVAGIFLPLLPTTPFILLAAWCFAKSSPRFHNWLLSHPTLGPIVHTWQNGDGIPRKVRNKILIVMWISMLLSMVIIGKWWSVALLAVVGACSTLYILKQPIADDIADKITDTPPLN